MAIVFADVKERAGSSASVNIGVTLIEVRQTTFRETTSDYNHEVVQ